MHSSKAALVASIFAFAFSTSLFAQQSPQARLSVAEKIEMAQRINDEKLRSELAAQESERLSAENEVIRMQIQLRELRSQKETSLTDIEKMKQELQRYQRLLANSATIAQRTETTVSPRSQVTTEPPLNMRLLNVLKGEGISTRARVVVLGDNGASQGEFQVKEGSSIQGWTIESINQNTIQVTKNGESYTYGSDGMM
jgi:septal ring factor EnvC (AmiA/AmiB activator)